MKRVKTVEAATMPISEPAPEEDATVPVVPSASESGLFDDLPDLPDPPDDIPAVRPDDGIPPLDTDLTVDEKQEFIKLLNAEIPIAIRAHQLAKLARMTGSKTAAVGLRALQEINSVCGLSSDKPTVAPSMFALPDGVSVSIKVEKVIK